jgi:hypothetical protein
MSAYQGSPVASSITGVMSDGRRSFGLVFVEAGGTGSGSGSGNIATATGGPLGTTTGPPPPLGAGATWSIGTGPPSAAVAVGTNPLASCASHTPSAWRT